MIPRRHRSLLPALAAAGVLAFAGCGDLESGDGGGNDGRGELTEGTTTNAQNRPKVDLPPRPAGVVEIQGQVDGSVTEEVVSAFPAYANRSGIAVSARAADTDEDRGFAALCEGQLDITAASRRITDAELQACEANGLEVVDFQVAFDAIVIVTRNERDVGADCLNLAQVRAIYQAGSPITSWNQLNPNFKILNVEAAGPTDQTSDFDFFGARVLGVPDPTLANFRSDYRAFPQERQVKNFVAKMPPGAVGILGFSFYELFEEKLRPLEIDGQTGDRCVFPSDETISSELYPLERTLRLYTTTRSLDRQEVKAYIEFHLTQAESIARRLELIPLPDQLREQEIARIADPTLSTVPSRNEDAGAAAEDSGTSTTDSGQTTTDGTATTTEEATETTTDAG